MKSLLHTASELDRGDELAPFRERFHIPGQAEGEPRAYLCGHSLGLQPRAAEAAVAAQLARWRDRAVQAHFEGDPSWIEFADELVSALSPLVGAAPAEVAVMNSLTINLHLMMISFYRPQGRRRKILIERGAFPSDRYACASQIRFHGLDPNECLVELEPRPGQFLIEEEAIVDFLRRQGDEIALVVWPGVQYVTGQAFDLARITVAAHDAGALAGFDLAHAVGNVPLALHDSGCDFAVWCHYKYLNAGPGAVAGAFVHARHHGDTRLGRLHGWWGNAASNRFEMAQYFTPAAGADAWQISTPQLLSMVPLRPALDILQQAGMQRLRAKSRKQTAFVEQAVRSHLDAVLEIITPADPERRGCQLSLRVRAGRTAGRQLFAALEENGVVADWREPDVIRVAPAPLYNSYRDCLRLVEALAGWALATGSPSGRSV